MEKSLTVILRFAPARVEPQGALTSGGCEAWGNDYVYCDGVEVNEIGFEHMRSMRMECR